MTSEKRVAANQKNAGAGTGPRTAEGKMAVRLNAVRHGLRSQDALLPDEDPHELNQWSEQLRDELKPQGPLEEMLVERMVLGMWRLKRLERVEAGVFASQYYALLRQRATADAQGKEDLGPRGIRMAGVNYHVAPPAEEKQHALARQKEAEAGERSDVATLGQAFMRSAKGDAFSKLSRYEAGLERSVFKAMHELQRLQDAREGRPVVPPIALDVNLTTG